MQYTCENGLLEQIDEISLRPLSWGRLPYDNY